jgi:hypothetical protein
MASQGYRCHGWFINGLIELVKPERLDLGEWDDAKAVLEGFFYTKQAWSGEELDGDLWNEVLLKAACKFVFSISASSWLSFSLSSTAAY